MEMLKLWRWVLFIAAGGLWFYTWLYYPDIPNMNNAELILIILSIVCLLLAVTVWLIDWVLKQNR